MTRQQRRRIEFKVRKDETLRQRRNLAALQIDDMRAKRRPSRPGKRIPGPTLLTPGLAQQGRAPGSRRGAPNRRIVATKVQRVPAVTIQVSLPRRTVVMIPERRYENTFHATKGPRSVRTCA